MGVDAWIWTDRLKDKVTDKVADTNKNSWTPTVMD